MTDPGAALRSTAVVIGVISILLCVGCAGFSSKSSTSEESASVQAATGTDGEPVATGAESASVTTGIESEPVGSGAGSEPIATETSSESKVIGTTSTINMPASVQEEAKPSPSGEASPATPEQTMPSENEVKLPPDTEPGNSVAKLESVKPTAPSPVVQIPATKAAPEQVTKQEEAPLDLELLEKRLKETSSIGFFTKIALKNQVDELVDKFRAFYEGHSNFSLAQLRQPFDLLIMKVLALLQDRDPQLANDILVSREAIWDILSDQEKFAKI